MTALDWFDSLPVQTLEAHGAPLAYRQVGSGPPLVFVHGWPLSGVTFRDIARALSAEYTCYVIDLPGAGDSPINGSATEFFQSLADVVDAFTDALALDGYGLVGFDSGAAGARLHAARHPERVRALFMSNTEVPQHVAAGVVQLQKQAKLPGARMLFRALLGSSLFLRSSRGFGGCFSDKDVILGTFRDANVARLRGAIDGAFEQVLRADLHASDALLSEANRALHMPSRLFWGADDGWFPRDGAERLAAELPGCEGIEFVDRAKLFVHEEHPERFARSARAFFDSHLAAERTEGRKRA